MIKRQLNLSFKDGRIIAGNIYCPGCKTEIAFTKLISLHPYLRFLF